MSDDQWVSVHIYYHADLDVVLHRMVAPLVAELLAREIAEQFFFIRHWSGGPHVRLRIRPLADSYRAEIERRVRDRATALFRAFPAPSTMDQPSYRRRAATLAKLEALVDYPTELQDNNSVVMVPYCAERDRFGEGDALAAVERHFVTCSRMVMDLLGSATAPQRSTLAFSLILLAWLSYGDDALELMTLVPAGLAADPTQEQELARGFERQRETLQSLARHVGALTRHPPPLRGDGALGRWLHSVAEIRRTSADFRTYLRVVDTCAHLASNRLGISMGEERNLRYLAGHTLQAYRSGRGPLNVA